MVDRREGNHLARSLSMRFALSAMNTFLDVQSFGCTVVWMHTYLDAHSPSYRNASKPLRSAVSRPPLAG